MKSLLCRRNGIESTNEKWQHYTGEGSGYGGVQEEAEASEDNLCTDTDSYGIDRSRAESVGKDYDSGRCGVPGVHDQRYGLQTER